MGMGAERLGVGRNGARCDSLGSGIEDGIFFVEHDDAREPIVSFGEVEEDEAHDDESIAYFAEVRCSAVEDDGAAAMGAWDSVGFEAMTVGEVAAEDAFVGEEADAFHEVGGDGEAALVIEAGGGDFSAVDF
jgi:hypothetical protein